MGKWAETEPGLQQAVISMTAHRNGLSDPVERFAFYEFEDPSQRFEEITRDGKYLELWFINGDEFQTEGEFRSASHAAFESAGLPEPGANTDVLTYKLTPEFTPGSSEAGWFGVGVYRVSRVDPTSSVSPTPVAWVWHPAGVRREIWAYAPTWEALSPGGQSSYVFFIQRINETGMLSGQSYVAALAAPAGPEGEFKQWLVMQGEAPSIAADDYHVIPSAE